MVEAKYIGESLKTYIVLDNYAKRMREQGTIGVAFHKDMILPSLKTVHLSFYCHRDYLQVEGFVERHSSPEKKSDNPDNQVRINIGILDEQKHRRLNRNVFIRDDSWDGDESYFVFQFNSFFEQGHLLRKNMGILTEQGDLVIRVKISNFGRERSVYDSREEELLGRRSEHSDHVSFKITTNNKDIISLLERKSKYAPMKYTIRCDPIFKIMETGDATKLNGTLTIDMTHVKSTDQKVKRPKRPGKFRKLCHYVKRQVFRCNAGGY